MKERMKKMRSLRKLMAALAGLALAFSADAAETLVVDSANGPYYTIQSAIEASSAGDTISIAAGEYGTDGDPVANATFGPSRVVVNRDNLKIVGAGRGKTVIVGATTDGKVGANGVRGILVMANNVKISNLTVRNGGTANVSDAKGYGGGLCTDGVGTEIVDCDFFGCVAKAGASLYCGKSEGMLAARCRLSTGFDVESYNPIVSNTALYFCILDHHFNTSGSFIAGTQPMIHCTVSNVALHHLLDNDSQMEVCNSVLGSYIYRFGGDGSTRTGGKAYHVVSDITEAYKYAADTDEGCVFGTVADFVSTIKGDYRLTSVSPAVNAASADFLLRIPEAYRDKDYFGNAVDPANLHCGAVQEAVDVPTARLEIVLPEAGDAIAIDGVTEVSGYASTRLYDHAMAWPSYQEIVPVFKSGAPLYGFTSNDGPARFPLLDGRCIFMAPPKTVSPVRLTARPATQVLWVDGESTVTDADGTTESTAFANIQDAVDAVSEQAYAIINVKKGTYDKGGANTYGSLNNRVQIHNRFVRLVGIDGSAETFLVGAPDPDSTDSGLLGCGSGATRCLYSDKVGAIQGFTLTGGRAGAGTSGEANSGAAIYAAAPFSVLDCIVSNNVSGNASIGCGASHEGKVTFLRSRIQENGSSFSGSYARFANFASCLVAFNKRKAEDVAVFNEGETTVFDSTFFTYGDGTCAMGGATFGNVATNEYGVITNATGNTWRNVIVCGYGFFRNNKAFGCVIDKIIYNGGGKETYVTKLMGTEGRDWLTLPKGKDVRAGFVDYVNGDFRLRADSVSIGYARYDAAESPDAYKYATCDLLGVFPDFSVSGRFAPGAYRTPVPVVSVVNGEDGQKIVPALAAQVVEVGDTIEFSISPTRPFLGFTVDGELQEYTGTNFTWIVPSASAAHTVSALFDNNWYVATNGSDTAIGNMHAPLKTLKAALGRTIEGDVVNACPGRYSEGRMDHSEYWTIAGAVTVQARAVVPKNRKLVSTDGPDVTFIEGEEPSNPDSIGCGSDGLRCVVLDEFATLKGFTLTNGHADDPNADSDNSRGGGIYGRNGNSEIYDCVISNNCARQGGGGFYGSYTRCRFVENRSSDSGAALRNANAYDCYFGRNRGPSTLCQCSRFIGSTMDDDNTGLDGGQTTEIADMGSPFLFENSIIMASGFLNTNKKTWSFTNCVLKAGISYPGGRELYLLDADTKEWTSEEIALDDFGAPTAGTSFACDRGRADIRTKYSRYYADDAVDCARRPRYVNGLKLDVGCYEADWKFCYSKKLGGLATVTSADPSVELTQDGITIPPDAALSVTVARPSLSTTPIGFDAKVAEGRLVVSKSGIPWRTLTPESVMRQTFVADSDSMTFDFAAGEGDSATLVRFFYDIGMRFIIR